MAASAYTDTVQKVYIAYYGRAADPVGLAYWSAAIDTAGGSLSAIMANFGASAEATTLYGSLTSNTAKVNALYQQSFGRDADFAGLMYYAGQLSAGTMTAVSIAQNIFDGASGTDATLLTNKLTVAKAYTAAIDTASEVVAYSGTVAAASARTLLSTVDATTVTTGFDVATSIASIVTVSNAAAAVAAQTITLTTGADTLTGGAGNDTFTASEIATVQTFTAGDTLTGGAGTDTLNYTSSTALAVPVGFSASGIETVNATSAVDANVFSTATKFGGHVTTLNVVGIENQTVTGGAGTAVTVTETKGTTGDTVTIDGGSSITLTSVGAGAIGDGATGHSITVGATTAAVGAVNITASETSALVANADIANVGAIAVTGGSTITIASTIASTAAANTTVLTGSVDVGHTQGAITVTGNASTTDVSVTQSAAVAAVSSASIGRVGIEAGTVAITDANAASTSAAGTITTMSLTNVGAATINSGALTTLNLAGTMSTVNLGTSGALTTAANAALTLNLTGAVASGAVTVDADFKTLNVSGNTTASTLSDVVNAAVTNINVSGDAKVTFTDFDPATITDVVVTNTGGFALNTSTLAVGTNFAGGAGADTIKIGVLTKAITMGAGNDTVTSTGIAGTGGSVAAGDGTDTIIMTSAESIVADNNATFNTAFTGFETLHVSGAFAATAVLDLDGINDVSKVIVAGAIGHASTAKITNIDSGGTVEFRAGIAGMTVNVDGAVSSSTDVLNVNMASTGILTNVSFTAANVETLNISTADFASAGSAAVKHVFTVLAAADATTINVSGNNGLTVTGATGSVLVTTFDASGVVGNTTAATTFKAATTDTAANLAVTYASLNATAGAIVAITGGAGNDILTGSTAASNVDTITGGEGADVITGGTGNDTIVLTESTAAIDKVVFSGAAATNALTVAANGVDTITGFGSTDTLNLAALGDATANASTVFSNSAASIRTMAVTEVNVLTTDGTAASITTSGTATLAVADYTAATLTNVAAFLSEGYQAAGATTDAGAFVINDANTNLTYVYNFINTTAAATIIAGELVLVGTIDNGGTDLVAANIVFS